MAKRLVHYDLVAVGIPDRIACYRKWSGGMKKTINKDEVTCSMCHNDFMKDV